MLCYCGSQRPFLQCCQPFINKTNEVETCEQLMRSRYTAYCIQDAAYIFATYHPSMHTTNSLQQISEFAQASHFINLHVISSQQEASAGNVLFTVRYLQGNSLFEFTENSRFVLETNWLYVAGELTEYPTQKIGRNDLCPCGSNKKFKQCSAHNLSGNLNAKH